MGKLQAFLRARTAGEVALIAVVAGVTMVAIGVTLGEAIANFAAAV